MKKNNVIENDEDIFELEELKETLGNIKMSTIIKFVFLAITITIFTSIFKMVGVYTMDMGHEMLFGVEIVSFIMGMLGWMYYVLK